MVEDDADLQQLILAHYGELSPAAQRALDERLAREPALRVRRDALQDALRRGALEIDTVAEQAVPPDLADRLWRGVSASIAADARAGATPVTVPGGRSAASDTHPAPPRPLPAVGAAPATGEDRPGAAPADTGRDRTSTRGGAAPAAWLALAASVLVFVAGIAFEAGRNSPRGGVAIVDPATPSASRDRVLFAEVHRHLGDSERLLVELVNEHRVRPVAPDAQAQAAEAAWARTLLFANRLYRFAAERSGQHRIAAVLRDLEPLLIDLANGTPRDAATGYVEASAAQDTDALLARVRSVRRATPPSGPGAPGDRASGPEYHTEQQEEGS